MERAGVPAASVVSYLTSSGQPVSMEDLGCLLANHVDAGVVRAAARLNTRQEPRPQGLERVSQQGPGRLRLELECGSAVLSPSTDGRVHLTGTTTASGSLSWSEDGGRITARIVDRDGPTGDADLPRFQGAPRPEPSRRRLPCADVELQVPPILPVVVDSTRASIQVLGLAGSLDITDHFGRVEVVGENDDVRVRTTDGDIRTDTAATTLDVDTVSGRVVLGAGAKARVSVNSISGDVWVWGGPMERLDVRAVSGNIRVYGGFAPGATSSLISHGGDIEARVPNGRVEVSSHEGQTLGLDRAQRAGADTFPNTEGLGAAWTSLFSAAPTRWWFPAGAVVASTLEGFSKDYDLKARSFSGRVDVLESRVLPAPTGPILSTLMGVSPRLDACATEQFARSGGEGHAVATLVIGPTGEIERLTAPTKASEPEAVADGALEACVVSALEGLTFDGGARTRLRWPVRYHAPLVLPDPDLRDRQLRALALP